MLQQTQVSRVLGRWAPFVKRWPTPESCAASAVDDVLRAWQGLGYPRRALALHRSAAVIARDGWPRTEAGLRALPGVGSYTARALLAFAFAQDDAGPPQDVNLRRVAARATMGVEAHEARPADVDALLETARIPGVSMRHHAYALFDIGALICTARAPGCAHCPLAADCRSRERLTQAPPTPPPRRQARFQGSVRQLRGAILRAQLGAGSPMTLAALQLHLADQGIDAALDRVLAAQTALVREGLLSA